MSVASSVLKKVKAYLAAKAKEIKTDFKKDPGVVILRLATYGAIVVALYWLTSCLLF